MGFSFLIGQELFYLWQQKKMSAGESTAQTRT